MRPIIPWPGSKRRLAQQLLALIPTHVCYCEPFAGAAAMLFAKAPSKCEVINDINGELVNLYRVVQNHLAEFVRQFEFALASRQIYEWEQMKRPETLTDIQRAARFFYLQRTSFGGKVTGQTLGVSATSAPRINILRIEEMLSAAHLRLASVQIELLGWRECIERYDRPDTLFFLDPPYWATQGYGVDFPMDEYHAIAEAMRSMKGSAILTINDHIDMRKVFAGFKRRTVSTSYTIGGGHKAKPVTELVYTTFPNIR